MQRDENSKILLKIILRRKREELQIKLCFQEIAHFGINQMQIIKLLNANTAVMKVQSNSCYSGILSPNLNCFVAYIFTDIWRSFVSFICHCPAALLLLNVLDAICSFIGPGQTRQPSDTKLFEFSLFQDEGRGFLVNTAISIENITINGTLQTLLTST